MNFARLDTSQADDWMYNFFWGGVKDYCSCYCVEGWKQRKVHQQE